MDINLLIAAFAAHYAWGDNQRRQIRVGNGKA